MVAALALLSSFVLASATILIRLGLRGGGPYTGYWINLVVGVVGIWLAVALTGGVSEVSASGVGYFMLAGLVGTEGREDVVAGVLQHLAAMGLDDRRAARERTVHHRADGLGVEVLRERGRADDVEEQDADLPEGPGGFGGWCRRRGQCRQPGLERRQGQVDHRVAQHTALGLEGLDAELELLLFRRHRRASYRLAPLAVRPHARRGRS